MDQDENMSTGTGTESRTFAQYTILLLSDLRGLYSSQYRLTYNFKCQQRNTITFAPLFVEFVFISSTFVVKSSIPRIVTCILFLLGNYNKRQRGLPQIICHYDRDGINLHIETKATDRVSGCVRQEPFRRTRQVGPQQFHYANRTLFQRGGGKGRL